MKQTPSIKKGRLPYRGHPFFCRESTLLSRCVGTRSLGEEHLDLLQDGMEEWRINKNKHDTAWRASRADAVKVLDVLKLKHRTACSGYHAP
eukprot:1679016-Amphidinium_carterae.1